MLVVMARTHLVIHTLHFVPAPVQHTWLQDSHHLQRPFPTVLDHKCFCLMMPAVWRTAMPPATQAAAIRKPGLGQRHPSNQYQPTTQQSTIGSLMHVGPFAPLSLCYAGCTKASASCDQQLSGYCLFSTQACPCTHPLHLLVQANINLNFLYFLMATAICGAVPPLAASITWAKTSKFAAITCELPF